MRIAMALALACGLLAAPGWAAETTTYSYDTLGRLTASSITGGPSAGVATGINYDAAGNRSQYSINGAASAMPLQDQRRGGAAQAGSSKRHGGLAGEMSVGDLPVAPGGDPTDIEFLVDPDPAPPLPE